MEVEMEWDGKIKFSSTSASIISGEQNKKIPYAKQCTINYHF